MPQMKLFIPDEYLKVKWSGRRLKDFYRFRFKCTLRVSGETSSISASTFESVTQCHNEKLHCLQKERRVSGFNSAVV